MLNVAMKVVMNKSAAIFIGLVLFLTGLTVFACPHDILPQTIEDELEEVKDAVKGKYFKKKIDAPAFRKIMQEYEQKLTEIEVKINRIEKQK